MDRQDERRVGNLVEIEIIQQVAEDGNVLAHRRPAVRALPAEEKVPQIPSFP
jgi:hypothetical protein